MDECSMTPDAIRHLDGPALTRLAFTLQLAPPGVQEVEVPEQEGGVLAGPRPCIECWHCRDDGVFIWEWEPHRRLDQAYTAFHELHSRGVCTIVKYYPREPTPVGQVSAWHMGDLQTVTATFGEDPQEEAHALLLVACLVVASHPVSEYT